MTEDGLQIITEAYEKLEGEKRKIFLQQLKFNPLRIELELRRQLADFPKVADPVLAAQELVSRFKVRFAKEMLDL